MFTPYWCFLLSFMLFTRVKCNFTYDYDYASSEIDGKNCMTLLEDLASTTANFTKCFIQHARPIKVCQECVEDYMNVVDSHTQIMNLKDRDTGAACKMILVNVDRLEVVEGSFRYVQDQWKKASCQKCFENNSTKLTSDTNEILKLHYQTEKCENNTMHNSPGDLESDVCTACQDIYQSVNDFYDGHGAHDKFCMDIIDMMNTTRFKWSVTLRCCSNRLKPQQPCLILASAICSLPAIFYCIVWLGSKTTLLEFTQQSRWTQRFHHQRLSNTAS